MRSSTRIASTLAGLGLACTVAGCAAGNLQKGPSEALRAYAQAVRERRVEDAYALLAADAKRGMSLETFRKLVNENPAEVDELASSLARPATDPIVTATATLPGGDQVVLVYEHGRWRLDGSSLDLYGQLTPRQAVGAFLRAFEGGRYDILMRFVPDAKKVADERFPALDEARLREAWQKSDEMARIAQALRAALPLASIEESGDRATMPYGASGTLLLVREHGLWKIESFD